MANLFQPSLTRATDSNGDPISGAKMYFFRTETANAATWYRDEAGLVAGTNPHVADSTGMFEPAFLDENTVYRIRQTDDTGASVIWDVDPVRGYDETQIYTLGEEVAAAAAQVAADTVTTEGYRDETEAFRDETETLRDEAETLVGAITQLGNATIYATWTALAAAIGMAAGDAAVILEDAGTHTDPVVGGTVDNTGVYIYSASPAGWGRVADTEAIKAADQVTLAEGFADAAAASAASAASAVAQFVVEVDTPLYSLLYLGEDGHILGTIDSDGIEGGPNQDFLLAEIAENGTTEIATSNDEIYLLLLGEDGHIVDKYVVVDGTGYWVSLGTVSTGTELTTPVGDANLVLWYGQSPGQGDGTIAISTSPFAGLKMFTGGPDDFDYSNPANLAAFVNLVESGDESACRGFGEGFLQFYEEYGGTPFTANGAYLVVTETGEGGKSASELADGGAYFGRNELAIDAAAVNAAALGDVPGVLAVPYVQGEQDVVNGTNPDARQATIENGIRKPIEDYAASVFKRPTRIIMPMTQVASHQYYGVSDPIIARSVLAACIADDNYAFAGTMYQFDYGAASIGSHLLNGTEMKWMGAMVGRAAALIALGLPVPFIRPLRAWQLGLRTVVVEYDVPVAPLVLDDTTIDDPGAMGFELFSDSTEMTISSVRVGGDGRSVVIVAGEDIPAGTVRVDYAHSGGAANPVPAGRVTGSRGCLRDSTTDVFDPSGINKPMWHWAPIHRTYTS